VNSSRALKIAALAAAIAATVAVKAVTANRVDPATIDNLRGAVVKLLSRERFETQVSNRFGFVVDAQRDRCRLQVRQTFFEGFNLDANSLNAPKGARILFAYRGELLREYPALRISTARNWHRIMWRLGVDDGWVPPVTIAAIGDCALENLPWGELAGLHAS
jgi:hypothetical protein